MKVKQRGAWFSLALAGMLLLCAACGRTAGGPVTGPVTSTGAAAEPASISGEPTETSVAPPDTTERRGSGAAATKTTASPSGTVLPMVVNHEIKQNGLVLRVRENSIGHFTGEAFTLTAEITNTTRQDLTYGVGTGTPGMHMEIQLHIEGPGGARFTDMDTWGKIMTMDYKLATLKAGETYTQTMRLLPGVPRGEYWQDISKQQTDWFPAGEYQGTAVFTYYPDPGGFSGEAKQVVLAFPIIMV